MSTKRYYLDAMGIASWEFRKPRLHHNAATVNPVYSFGRPNAAVALIFTISHKALENPFTTTIKTLILQMLKSIGFAENQFYALAFSKQPTAAELFTLLPEKLDLLLILDDPKHFPLKNSEYPPHLRCIRIHSPYYLLEFPENKKSVYLDLKAFVK